MLYHDDASYEMLEIFDSKTFDWLIVLKYCGSFGKLADTKLRTAVDGYVDIYTLCNFKYGVFDSKPAPLVNLYIELENDSVSSAEECVPSILLLCMSMGLANVIAEFLTATGVTDSSDIAFM